MHDPTHPMWPIVRLTVLMATLVTVLWMNAASFDGNEIATLVATFVAAASVESAIKRVTGR
ncbi:hypothetical protein [uncultured Mediterranean phage uvDeep-CGR2-KM19-C37]|nr:hypothetical protein [uncultured Mediterranean phage uvDeep-CGR2-KM19-C37]